MAEENSQVAQLKQYLKSIMARQADLQQKLDEKNKKAQAAKKLTTGESIRSLQIETDVKSNSNAMVARMQGYVDEVAALEKELEETNLLVEQCVGALKALSP